MGISKKMLDATHKHTKAFAIASGILSTVGAYDGFTVAQDFNNLSQSGQNAVSEYYHANDLPPINEMPPFFREVLYGLTETGLAAFDNSASTTLKNNIDEVFPQDNQQEQSKVPEPNVGSGTTLSLVTHFTAKVHPLAGVAAGTIYGGATVPGRAVGAGVYHIKKAL